MHYNYNYNYNYISDIIIYNIIYNFDDRDDNYTVKHGNQLINTLITLATTSQQLQSL